MGWFDEQIKSRIQNDEEDFTQSLVGLSDAVLGRNSVGASLGDERKKTRTAIGEILKYYGIKRADGVEFDDLNEELEYCLRPGGVTRRPVKLTGKWYRDGVGPLLGVTKDGDTVALIPRGASGYTYFDYGLGKRVRVTSRNCGNLAEDAICFYRPLPLKALAAKDLVRYIAAVLSPGDYALTVLAALAAALIGLLMPYANNLIFSSVVPSGQLGLILPVTGLLLGVVTATLLITIVKNLILSRIDTKLNVSVQAAVMSRILSLPPDFFKEFSAGELAERAEYVQDLCQMLTQTVFSTALSSVFSLIYIGQIVSYAPSLAAPAVAVILLMLALTVGSSLAQRKISQKRMASGARLSGMTFALFSGIQKIKLSGAEKRAFSRWAGEYREDAELNYNPPLYFKLLPLLSGFVSMAGTVLIYFLSVRSHVSIADYMAFNVAYGMAAGGMMELAGVAGVFAQLKPVFSMISPILRAVPELAEGKTPITRLSGGIELNNVSFRYEEDMPNVIDNLSLKIRPGQYVAIVGKTGCGKSTLMRLLLGFESPVKGAIYYDGKDMSKLDLKSLRRHVGVVLQNGKLFSGDIFSNIVISAPWLSVEDAWEAAELAGIAEDIRNMPMGMHTMISEGNGGVSGGQRQRLMIARAVAPKPKILMFDEATSALDNITQRQVSDSLEKLKSTRIVIAHRLSTIKNCDRIVVLEGGKIVEDGNYDALIAKDGYFAELVRRQMAD